MVRLGRLAACLGLLSAGVSAEDNELKARQANLITTGVFTSVVNPIATGSLSGTITSPPLASATGGSGSASSGVQSGNRGSNQTTSLTVDVDPRAQAGGVSLMTPAIISGSQYYKIGDYVTFVWNYTSLSITPSAVDILVTGNANKATYTLASNQTWQPTATVLWDTSQFTGISVSLLTQIYTLVVHDADKEANAPAQPGYLATFQNYKFGMYLKENYVPLNDFRCVTCNAGPRTVDTTGVRSTMAMGVLAALSSVWLVAGIF